MMTNLTAPLTLTEIIVVAEGERTACLRDGDLRWTNDDMLVLADALGEVRAEAARTRIALDVINEFAFDALAHDDHVEHIIEDHGPEDTKAHYRCLAKQMLKVQAACSVFFDSIIEAIEAKAEAAVTDAIAYCRTYSSAADLPRCGAHASVMQFGEHRAGSPWKCSREPEHEGHHVAIDNDGKTVRAQWSASVSASVSAPHEPDPCTCGEINARHCPVHNEPGS